MAHTVMEPIEVTLAERGQIVIPKEARDALGLRPGARLQVWVEDGRLLVEKRVRLDLSRWVGKAVDDGLTTEQALTEMRGRPVPWPEQKERGRAAQKRPRAVPKSSAAVKARRK
jgi:AbrB family looped-hinge helix DNA binding protein